MVIDTASDSQRATFQRLIEQYAAPLKRLAGAYLPNQADREDLFQEIAIALWQAIPKFRHQSSERTWLYRIAHNVAITSASRVRRTGQRECNRPEFLNPPSGSSSSEDNLLAGERRRHLLEGIRSLPATDCQIVLLHLEGLSYSEIEEVTGLSETAVATRLTRIRAKLKEQISNKEVGKL